VTRRPKLDGTIAVVAVPGGDAVARRLVDEGALVVVTGTAGDEIGRLLAELEGGPGRVAHFHSDLTSDDDIDALVEFVEEIANRPPVS
jgi:NAD(P)-dependent dehydrogenase (short-subunit alcohol dehydrogenase family)